MVTINYSGQWKTDLDMIGGYGVKVMYEENHYKWYSAQDLIEAMGDSFRDVDYHEVVEAVGQEHVARRETGWKRFFYVDLKGADYIAHKINTTRALGIWDILNG